MEQHKLLEVCIIKFLYFFTMTGLNYSDCKYFKGGKMTDLTDPEQIFVWEVEKEAFDAHLEADDLKELMKSYISDYSKIGILIKYPYDI